MKKSLATALLCLPTFSVLAGSVQPPGNIPEPSALALLGVGVATGLIVWSRNRNKKK